MTAMLESLTPESRRLLKEAGFEWRAPIGMFVNHAAHKVISFERVRDHTSDWLVDWIDLMQDRRP
jgi:hypothetical protein